MALRSKSRKVAHKRHARHVSHVRRHARHVSHARSAARKTQKKSSWLSWIPFVGGANSDLAIQAPVTESGQLLSADMYGAPVGVDAQALPPYHATTGGAQRNRSRKTQRNSRQRSRAQRGGIAPVSEAYQMLLTPAESARAGLSPEWPGSN